MQEIYEVKIYDKNQQLVDTKSFEKIESVTTLLLSIVPVHKVIIKQVQVGMHFC
jgi:hypothetical protein